MIRYVLLAAATFAAPITAETTAVDSSLAASASSKSPAAVDAIIEIEMPDNRDALSVSDAPSAGAETAVPDSLTAITRMPEIKTFVEAGYPPEVVRQGIEGPVLMELLVNDSGKVDSVTVVKGLHPLLDSSAVVAARQFVFSPAMADTSPVAVYLQYEYRFALQEVVQKTEKYINFSGHIFELGTRAPVADAMVVINFIDTLSDTALSVPFGVYRQKLGTFSGQYLEGDRLVSITDSTGFFQFYSLPACSIEVTVPAPGYEEFHERDVIRPSEALEATYRMRRVSYSEYEVVVYYKGSEEKEVSRRQLTLQEVKKVPGFSGDAVKVVQALPGVARPTFGSFQIVIRGAQTSSSKFMLDGVEIPILFHYGLKSTYNSDALDKVDFYPGGWGSRYGGAIGGIIEITGRKAKTDRWHGYADANFFDGSVMIEGPVTKKISVLATARRSFIGDLIKFAAQNSPQTLLMTTAPYYWDYIVRTDAEINADQHAYVTLFGVKDGLELITSDIRGGNASVDNARKTSNFETLFNMGIAGWECTINTLLSNSFKYSFSKVKNSANFSGILSTTTTYLQHYIRDQFTIATPRLITNIGLDMQFLPLDFDLTAPDVSGSINRIRKRGWLFGTIGGYLYSEWKPTDRLTLIPNLRYEFYPELDYSGAMVPEFWDYTFDNNTRFSGEPSLRMTGRYALTPVHTLKASAGTYTQSPQPEGQWILEPYGDPKMGATHAGQYVAGHEWQITDLIQSDVQVYYNRQWDIPRFPSRYEIATTKKPVVANGMRRMYGLEILLRHNQSERFFGWLAYSLSRAEFWDYETKRWSLISKDQTHNLIAVGSWTLPRNWAAGFKMQFTTGDPTTPIIGSVYDETYHYYQPISGEPNSARLDPTFQLDLRVDKKFIFKKWMLSAYVDFFNIGYFLYKSPQVVTTDPAEPYDYARMRANQRAAYQYSIPSIGLKAEF
jgi:TonB family protein